LGVAAPGVAQNITSGSISGTVVDQQNAVLPGASVEDVHGPTGTQYSETTDSGGRLLLPSAGVGGPYTVKVTLSGFRDQERVNIVVPLGDTLNLEFKLPLANVSET